jgi:hypothetical protein
MPRRDPGPRIVAIVAIAVLLWPGAAAAQDVPPPRDQILLSGEVTVPRGRTVGEVVTVNGVVDGDVVILEGPVRVSGQVNGSVIAADGRVSLTQSARVGGDVYSSERVRPAAGADVAGELRGEVRFSLEGPLAALGALLGPVAIAVSVLLTGLVLLTLAPRGADAVALALADAPLASLGWGIFLVVAVPVCVAALSVLVLGLPLGLAMLLSLGLWWLVGLTWAAWCTGRGIVRASHGRFVGFLAGWAILAAVGLVPVLNVAVWIVAPTLGLGAMLVASWRARHGAPPGGRHRARAVARTEASVEAGIA